MKITIPFVLRHIVSELNQYNLSFRLEVPMNFEYKYMAGQTGTYDDGTDWRLGKAKAYFAGGPQVAATIREWDDTHYGTQYKIERLQVSRKSYSREELEKWVKEVEIWTGPLNASFEQVSIDWKVTILIEGIALTCLQCNASWMRNDLPTRKWDDAEHPRHTWDN